MLRGEWEKIKDRIDSLPPPRPTPEKEPVYLPLSSPRAKLCRRRRRQGLRCVTLLAPEECLDALVQLGFLPRQERASRSAIEKALAGFLYANLIEKYQNKLWAKAERELRAALPKGSIRAPNGRFLPWKTRKTPPANLEKNAPEGP